MDRLEDPPTCLKVATTQEIDLQPWAPCQWTSTTTRWRCGQWTSATTRWRCGLILLPSLTLRSPHPQGEKWIQLVLWTIQSRHDSVQTHGQTDGQGDTSIPPSTSLKLVYNVSIPMGLRRCGCAVSWNGGNFLHDQKNLRGSLFEWACIYCIHTSAYCSMSAKSHSQ